MDIQKIEKIALAMGVTTREVERLIKQLEYRKEYNARPETREKRKEYNRLRNLKPEVRKKRKEYNRRRGEKIKAALALYNTTVSKAG